MKRFLQNESYIVDEDGCYLVAVSSNTTGLDDSYTGADAHRSKITILFPDADGEFDTRPYGTLVSNTAADITPPGASIFLVSPYPPEVAEEHADQVADDTESNVAVEALYEITPTVMVDGREYIVNKTQELGSLEFVNSITSLPGHSISAGTEVFAVTGRDKPTALFLDPDSIVAIGDGIYLPKGTQVSSNDTRVTVFFNWSNLNHHG